MNISCSLEMGQNI